MNKPDGTELFERLDAVKGIDLASLRELAEAEREGRIGSVWTPCAEGLPDSNDDVFITYEYQGKLIAAVGFMGHSGAWYIIYDDDCNEAKVNAIAWQPLPTPYNPDYNANADHIVDANKKIEPPYRADQKGENSDDHE